MSIKDFTSRLSAEEHKLLTTLRERKPARHPPGAGQPPDLVAEPGHVEEGIDERA